MSVKYKVDLKTHLLIFLSKRSWQTEAGSKQKAKDRSWV